MGDRANVFVRDGDEHGVYLYTHGHGTVLPGILRDALRRGKGRWDDSQYLARIIFCEMVKNDVKGLTGFGITSRVWDGDDRVIVVDPDTLTVKVRNRTWSFEEFCALDSELETDEELYL